MSGRPCLRTPRVRLVNCEVNQFVREKIPGAIGSEFKSFEDIVTKDEINFRVIYSPDVSKTLPDEESLVGLSNLFD